VPAKSRRKRLALEDGRDTEANVPFAAIGRIVFKDILREIGAVGERGEGGAGAALA